MAVDGVSLAPILLGNAASVRDPNEGYVLTETRNPLAGNTEQVGARNARYKVICSGGEADGGCEFYDLVDDPLEEYPLPIPDGCALYADRTWSPADASWHYCRLTDIVDRYSFL